MGLAFFTAIERFDAANGDRWRDYCEWAKIPALREVVSLDQMLCPPVIDEYTEEDWEYVGNAEFSFGFFRNLDYLIGRIPSGRRANVLGVYRNPVSHIDLAEEQTGGRPFAFLGYDLIEDMTGISSLTNCGGFPRAFSNDELNEFGLVFSFARASEIQRVLNVEYPDESHADCELYAIWRLEE